MPTQPSSRSAVIPAPNQRPGIATGPERQAVTGEVLVDVTLAALNPADLLITAGAYPGGTPPTPYVIAQEAVGVVRSAADDADAGLVGRRVWLRTRGAAHPSSWRWRRKRPRFQTASPTLTPCRSAWREPSPGTP